MTYFSQSQNGSFDSTDQTSRDEEAYVYAAGIVICAIVSVCFTHPFFIYSWRLGIRLRVTCSSMIFRKALRLRRAYVIPGLSGKMINLMTCDAQHFNYSNQFLHMLWKGPLEVIIFNYFLYREIGIYSFIGVGLFLCIIPIQSNYFDINFTFQINYFLQ